VRARGMIREVTHPVAGTIPIANTPVRMSRSETGITGPPPDLGGDTADVLGELLGLGEEEIRALAERGVLVLESRLDISEIT